MEINKIYHENCLDTLKRMPNKFVDLVVTSPPYNMRTRIRNGVYTTREKSEHFSKKYKHFSDDLPIDEFYSFHTEVLNELLRVSKIICYNFQIVTGSKEAFFKIIGNFNRDIKDIIIWDKGNGQPAMHGMVLNSCYEMILIFEDDKRAGRAIQNAKFNRGEMNNILRIGRGEKVFDGHSAVFPEMLAGQLIKAFSEEGNLIYDPFIGSGTTGIVAQKLNRNYIGSEITEEYYNMAKQRIQNAAGLFSQLF
jgi:site-specific DNA-methyltransferase (adenine-specific)/modification methylase